MWNSRGSKKQTLSPAAMTGVRGKGWASSGETTGETGGFASTPSTPTPSCGTQGLV